MPGADGSAFCGLLDGWTELLHYLTDEQYILHLDVVGGSIGQHIRHCLDHFTALLDGSIDGRIDYDQRVRGTAVEFVRLEALNRISLLQDRLRNWTVADDRPLRLRYLPGPHQPVREVTTSLGRERAFVLSHAVHHNALITVSARLLGVRLPRWFGCAPSTIQAATVACVPSA